MATHGKIRVLVVDAPYYAQIAEELKAGAIEALESAGVEVEVLSVPGAFEIPAAIAHAAGMTGGTPGRYDAFIALGCVIRGETTHYDYVCNECARGLQQLALNHGLAIGFGVLTVENGEQAWARALRTKKNKGAEAARAALAMVAIRQRYAAGE